MSEKLDYAFDLLMLREGGYSNNPQDPGGETMWGVTARVARAWGYSGPMVDLPRETAKSICEKLYWTPLRCEEFDQRIGFQLVDAIYNGGRPVLWMQQASGARADGVLGPATVAAVQACESRAFIMRFLSLRQRYLTACKPWPTFGRGWINRTSENLMEGAR